VLDDLDLKFGKLKFNAESISNFDSELEQQKANWAKCLQKLKQAEEEFRKPIEGSSKIDQIRAVREALDDTDNGSQHFTRTMLSQLFSHLKKATEFLTHSEGEYLSEPVIIISTTGAIPPLYADRFGYGEKTVWQHLHNSEALRKRTVVLFDVESLRKVIPISTGLSWERTAQDTIVGLQSNRLLRPFLRFGNVIVRFGVTGLLLISINPRGESNYTLYFSPEYDDTEFSHRDDGEVFGATSILAATLVEQLAAQCRWRNGKAVFQDTFPAFSDALNVAINRMVCHYELGYGNDIDSFERSLTGVSQDVFLRRADLISQSLDSSQRNGPANFPVQSIRMSPIRSSHWSILGQSSQIELYDISENIVLLGSGIALNTMEHPVEDLVRHWIETTLVILRESDPNYSLFRPNEHREGTSLAEALIESFFGIIFDKDPITRRLIGEPCHASLRKFLSDLEKNEVTRNHFIEVVRASLDSSNQDLREHLDELAAKGKGKVNDAAESMQELLNDETSSENDLLYAFNSLYDKIRDKAVPPGNLVAIRQDNLLIPEIILGRTLINLLRSLEPTYGWTRTISTPILRLGNPPRDGGHDERLIVVDRNEVESIRAVMRSIDQYLRMENRSRPLSIAVFGPPGAGKSIAVNKVISMMKRTGVETKKKTINLSKLGGIEDLTEKLNGLARDAAQEAKRKVPIIFFDEFDSPIHGEPLGWLKYFLSIMEDGDPIKNAVYVFAGGTADSFESFSLANRSQTDIEWVEFAKSKGPDFVSRLKGHINVAGVNSSGPDDDLYVIRRALALRFLLAEKQKLKDGEQAKIDRSMVNAFLHVPEYRHGSRSMRVLLDLCTGRDGIIISRSEVPPIHQLDMQVDGKAFNALASGQTVPVKTMNWDS